MTMSHDRSTNVPLSRRGLNYKKKHCIRISTVKLLYVGQVGSQECKNVKLNGEVLNGFVRDFKERNKDRPETQCMNTVMNLLNNIQNCTLWATWSKLIFN